VAFAEDRCRRKRRVVLRRVPGCPLLRPRCLLRRSCETIDLLYCSRSADYRRTIQHVYGFGYSQCLFRSNHGPTILYPCSREKLPTARQPSPPLEDEATTRRFHRLWVLILTRNRPFTSQHWQLAKRWTRLCHCDCPISGAILFRNARISIADANREIPANTKPPRKLPVRWLIAPIA
jgi:hypothetical protein